MNFNKMKNYCQMDKFFQIIELMLPPNKNNYYNNNNNSNNFYKQPQINNL